MNERKPIFFALSRTFPGACGSRDFIVKGSGMVETTKSALNSFVLPSLTADTVKEPSVFFFIFLTSYPRFIFPPSFFILFAIASRTMPIPLKGYLRMRVVSRSASDRFFFVIFLWNSSFRALKNDSLVFVGKVLGASLSHCIFQNCSVYGLKNILNK